MDHVTEEKTAPDTSPPDVYEGSFVVELAHFNGPLDLLLSLIRDEKVDIYDIPIGRIADEYLDTVRTLQHLDLDAAADFVYTAALLIQIKARMLLPRPDLDADGEPIDPRTELVERLLEYIRYKEAAQHLEGGPEAQLVLRQGERGVEFVGSWESGFQSDRDRGTGWPVPNVLGVTRRAE